MPRISVVIPLYNYEKHIADCIESVLAQDFPSVEIVVVDDGSTDNGPSIARSYPGVRVIHQVRCGYGCARAVNRGIRESSGGLPKIQALGLWIPERNMAQVSMNLLDYQTTGFKEVFKEVGKRAKKAEVEVAESELIGLVPRDAFAEVSPEQLLLAGFSKNQIIENRLED